MQFACLAGTAYRVSGVQVLFPPSFLFSLFALTALQLRVALLLTLLHAATAAPRLLWTDVTSAPVLGHVVLGGYLLGDARGTGRVLFGTTPADNYVSWGRRQRGAETHQIEVQVPAGLATGNVGISVEIGGQVVGTPPFPIHTGTFYYAKPDGSAADACTSPNDNCSLRRARLRMSPGDVLYLRAGTYTKPDSFDPVNAPVKPVLFDCGRHPCAAENVPKLPRRRCAPRRVTDSLGRLLFHLYR